MNRKQFHRMHCRINVLAGYLSMARDLSIKAISNYNLTRKQEDICLIWATVISSELIDVKTESLVAAISECDDSTIADMKTMTVKKGEKEYF